MSQSESWSASSAAQSSDLEVAEELNRVSTWETLRGFDPEPGLEYSWTPDSVESSSGATGDNSSNMELRCNPIISIAMSLQSLIGKEARETNIDVEGSEKNEIRDENTDEEVTTCPSSDGTEEEEENQLFEGASISDMLVKPKESCPVMLISGSIDKDVECLVVVEERVERPTSSIEVHKMLESHKLLESDDETVAVESVSALEPNTKERRIRKMKRLTKSVGKTMSGLRSIFKRHDTVESVSALEPNTKERRIRKMKRLIKSKSVGKTMSGLRSIFKRHDRVRSKR